MMGKILPLSKGQAVEGRNPHRGRILVEGLRARQGTVRDPGVQGLLWEGRKGGGEPEWEEGGGETRRARERGGKGGGQREEEEERGTGGRRRGGGQRGEDEKERSQREKRKDRAGGGEPKQVGAWGTGSHSLSGQCAHPLRAGARPAFRYGLLSAAPSSPVSPAVRGLIFFLHGLKRPSIPSGYTLLPILRPRGTQSLDSVAIIHSRPAL